MALNIYQLLLNKLQEIQNTASVISDNWFEAQIAQLRDFVNKSDLNLDFKTSAIDAIATLTKNKETLIELGQYGLTLFLFQIGLGKTSEATETYIQALSSPDDLIALMNAGANGVIQAKKHLDQLEASAIALIEEIGMDAIKAILPFIIAMIPI